MPPLTLRTDLRSSRQLSPALAAAYLIVVRVPLFVAGATLAVPLALFLVVCQIAILLILLTTTLALVSTVISLVLVFSPETFLKTMHHITSEQIHRHFARALHQLSPPPTYSASVRSARPSIKLGAEAGEYDFAAKRSARERRASVRQVRCKRSVEQLRMTAVVA